MGGIINPLMRKCTYPSRSPSSEAVPTELFSSPLPFPLLPSPLLRDSLSVLLSFSPTPCCLNTLSLTLVLRVDSGISETIVIAIQGQLTLLLKPGSCLLTLLLHMPPFFNPNSKRHGHLLPFLHLPPPAVAET